MRPLAVAVDALFPSLYTFSQNRDAWVRSAIAHIDEARRYGTDALVYVFLWPQYHEITRGHALEYLDGDFWRLQIETAERYADGAVIWGGWDIKKNIPERWDENMPWWIETKSFISARKAR